jgi:hypothetical protein
MIRNIIRKKKDDRKYYHKKKYYQKYYQITSEGKDSELQHDASMIDVTFLLFFWYSDALHFIDICWGTTCK